MRIGILSSVGGTIDAFFPPLIAQWEKNGNVVFTAASTKATHSEHSILRSVTRNPSLRNFYAPHEISQWANESKLDIIITNTATVSFLARIRRLPVPVLYFCHGLHWNDLKGFKNKFWQGLELFALKNTDGVFVINKDDEQWFKQNFNPNYVYRLLPGVGVPISDFPRSVLPGTENGIRLVWAGEFSERKRPWLAVEVISVLRSMQIPVHLTMCGVGACLEETRKKINKLGLHESISLVGRQEKMVEIISASHALIMTSAWEGLPRIGLESIAVGRPVFAFDVKGTRSLPGVILAPELDVEELSRTIAEYAQQGFSGIDLQDPLELDPSYVADRITAEAQKFVKNSAD